MVFKKPKKNSALVLRLWRCRDIIETSMSWVDFSVTTLAHCD